MMDFLEKATRFLRAFVELGFLTVISIVLIYLILGQGSGVFITSVTDNILKFSSAVPTSSLIGLAIVGALIYLIMKRTK